MKNRKAEKRFSRCVITARRFAALFTTFALVLSSLGFASFADNTDGGDPAEETAAAAVTVSDASVETGGTVSVPIYIDAEKGLSSAQFSIEYDSDLISCTNGVFTVENQAITTYSASGVANAVWANENNPSFGADTPFMILTFKATDTVTADVTTEVSVSVTHLSYAADGKSKSYEDISTQSGIITIRTPRQEAALEIADPEAVYDGTAKSAQVKVTTPLEASADALTVTYMKDGEYVDYPVDAGTYDVTAVYDDGNYSGTAAGTLTILPKSLDASDFEVDTDNAVHTGSAVTKTITSELTEDTDYTVSYENNIDVGTAKIVIAGQGNYTGSVEYSFRIMAGSISESDFEIGAVQIEYSGEEISISVTPAGGLKENSDYTVSYKDASGNVLAGAPKSAGDYTLVITGMGDYDGTVEKAVTVLPKTLTMTDVTVSPKTYDGTTEADVTGTLDGVIGSDSVAVNSITAAFADPYAGTGKTAEVSEITLTGEAAANYTIDAAAITGLTGNITAAAQNLTVQDAQVNVGESLDLSTLVTSGVEGTIFTYSLSGDGAAYATLEGNTLTVKNENAAAGKTITVAVSGQSVDLNDDEIPEYESGHAEFTVTLNGTTSSDTYTLTLDTQYLGTAGAAFEGLSAGENEISAESIAEGGYSFTVNHSEACVVAYTTDSGETYTALTAVSTDTPDKYQFTVPVEGENIVVSVALRGDADLNGKLDIDDASTIARFKVNAVSLNSLQRLAADADKSGEIDIDDASAIAVRCVNKRVLEW